MNKRKITFWSIGIIIFVILISSTVLTLLSPKEKSSAIEDETLTRIYSNNGRLCGDVIEQRDFVKAGIFNKINFDSFLSELKKKNGILSIEEEDQCANYPDQECLPVIDITILKSKRDNNPELTQAFENGKNSILEIANKEKYQNLINKIKDSKESNEFNDEYYIFIYLNENNINQEILDTIMNEFWSFGTQFDSQFPQKLTLAIDTDFPHLPAIRLFVETPKGAETIDWLRDEKKMLVNDLWCCLHSGICLTDSPDGI